MADIEGLTQTERLLLMAACVQGLGPNTQLDRANTVRIVNQALIWLGVSPEAIRETWWRQLDSDDDGEQQLSPSLNEEVYSVLIRMIHQTCRRGPGRPPERAGPTLFEGAGNWGVPGDPDHPACMPHFNSCRLTARGEQLARELLEKHPEFRRSGEPDTC